ncbi:hypothetical protein QOT17_020459 [Balamuthia mandrillaris]
MRRQLAGPGTNKHVPKKDIGKEAPASTNVGDGYRQKSMRLRLVFFYFFFFLRFSPSDSNILFCWPFLLSNTNIIFIFLADSAAGPQSSHAEYVSTKDSGVQMPVSGGGGKEYFS